MQKPTYKNTLRSEDTNKAWLNSLDCMLAAFSVGYPYILWRGEVFTYRHNAIGVLEIVPTHWTEYDVETNTFQELA